jgi:acyl-coenzyme A thioesterase PaaI-like protein
MSGFDICQLKLAGLDQLIEAEFGEATADVATMTVSVTPNLLQPQGIVHGGGYCSMVETLGTVAGAIWLAGRFGWPIFPPSTIWPRRRATFGLAR